MVKNVFLCFVIILSQYDSQAKSKFGVEAGVSIANTLTETTQSTYTAGSSANNYRLSLRQGLALQAPMGKKSAFHTGLYYAAKGNTNLRGGKTISYNTIELPFSFAYSTNNHPKRIFWLGAGGYVAYAVNAKINYVGVASTEVSSKARFGPYNNIDDLRRFEYGMQLQSGLNFKNGIYFRVVAQRQLNNLANKKDAPLNSGYKATYPYYNIETLRSELYASLTVGYFFNFKKSSKKIKTQ